MSERVERIWLVPLLCALAALAITGFTGAAMTRTRDQVWTQAWHDEFGGPAWTAPDPANWRFALGRGPDGGPVGWGNNEVQSYSADPANIAQDGHGQLRITATTDLLGNWQSARIETPRADFAPPAGGSLKIEARIALPAGLQGYWPAFWMLGAPYRDHPGTWPAPGEIDVMENVNNSAEIHGTLHCDWRPHRPCHRPAGLGGVYTLPTAAGLAGPHTYTVVWDTHPKQVRWQVDGHTYHRLTPADIGKATWDETFGHGYFLLLNLAVGGNWPGPPGLATVPGQSMLVDYVRIWTAP